MRHRARVDDVDERLAAARENAAGASRQDPAAATIYYLALAIERLSIVSETGYLLTEDS
jgi:hypothetical protein